MEPVVILKVGVEGGGATVYGRQVNGRWTFWQDGSAMFMDENDDMDWRGWKIEPVSDLNDALPGNWCESRPSDIHPDFLDWFRDRYARLTPKQRRSLDVRHYRPHWERELNRVPPTAVRPATPR